MADYLVYGNRLAQLRSAGHRYDGGPAPALGLAAGATGARLSGESTAGAEPGPGRSRPQHRPHPAPRRLILQVDGTPGALRAGLAGVAAVIRGPHGHVWTWRCGCVPAATCNEAEYQAVIFGLQLVIERFPQAGVRCLTDSRVVVEQLTGRVAVRTTGLAPLHARAVALARRLSAAQFVHIPRELNRLADALAWEALEGRQLLQGLD